MSFFVSCFRILHAEPDQLNLNYDPDPYQWFSLLQVTIYIYTYLISTVPITIFFYLFRQVHRGVGIYCDGDSISGEYHNFPTISSSSNLTVSRRLLLTCRLFSDVTMGRRPARCYRYCKNKPYPKSRFNRYRETWVCSGFPVIGKA